MDYLSSNKNDQIWSLRWEKVSRFIIKYKICRKLVEVAPRERFATIGVGLKLADLIVQWRPLAEGFSRSDQRPWKP